MNRLKMHSLNKVEKNIEAIGAIFPNCITERKNHKGETELAIDFDQLRQELSSVVVEGPQERYQFTWPDKRESMLLANSPIAKTLRPCRAESKDFDNTENLYIEGDNLDVLKLLQETYLGKVKMIYIDPPYNTGKDTFVYDDDFGMNGTDFSNMSGQYDEEGNQLFDIRQNNESNGRFHTDWLNMIYPRLKVARDLLSDDGVIFISIDDNEVENLKKICDEIFGANNFISQINWISKSGGSADEKFVINATEYILVYTKNRNEAIFGRESIDTDSSKYNLSDKHENERGRYTLKKLDYRMTSQHYTESLNYPIKDPDGNMMWPGGSDERQDGGWNWRWSRTKVEWGFCNDFLEFRKNKNGWTLNSKQYQKVDNSNNQIDRNIAYKNYILSNEFNTTQGSRIITDFFQSKVFEYAKPQQLISHLMKIANINKSDIILDFFSGSATTAHAVMQLNAEDGGNRKFIMVQLPEASDEKSETYKAGYKNICEIGKERIRRAGEKIVAECKESENIEKLDTGFRVLKLDSTNMKDVFYNPSDYKTELFSQLTDNIKEDRTAEDLLFQVMLELGVALSASIVQSEIDGKRVFDVNDGYLVACFDQNVTEKTVTAIAKKSPYYFVLRDSSMASDSVATNFEQIFETYSKDTIRKVL